MTASPSSASALPDAAALQLDRTQPRHRGGTEPRHEADVEREAGAHLAIAQRHEGAAEALALARARDPAEERLAVDRIAGALQELRERAVVRDDEPGLVEQTRRDRQRADQLRELGVQIRRRSFARRRASALGSRRRRAVRSRARPSG